jgi:pyruvate-ferredoxin/flavodoxin oxidoreductase
MGKTQLEAKLAVDCGYWPLYRYNPSLQGEGKNPFSLDAKAPDGTIQEFLGGENRYALLEKIAPEESKRLRSKIEEEYMVRYEDLKYMAAQEPTKVAAHAPVEAGENGGDKCEVTATPEHARTSSGSEPCDDGRAGK